jgi:thiaminase/transcriptional activator TenA
MAARYHILVSFLTKTRHPQTGRWDSLAEASMPGFSDELRAAAADVWEAQHRHPFVRGIGTGTLELERFQAWVRQDYLFLIEYARMLSLGAGRAPDLEAMTRLAELAHSVLATEMSLHRSYCAEIGISERELAAEEMLPTTQGYTDFLVRVAAQGEFSEFAAALLPCMWGYCEVGERLAAQGRPGVERYDKWIDMYSSREFSDLARWCRELVDRIGPEATGTARNRMHRSFLVSSRYELAFWEMAWRGERWAA